MKSSEANCRYMYFEVRCDYEGTLQAHPLNNKGEHHRAFDRSDCMVIVPTGHSVYYVMFCQYDLSALPSEWLHAILRTGLDRVQERLNRKLPIYFVDQSEPRENIN
jgi:hypothetical protein